MLHVGAPPALRNVIVPAVAVYGMALPATVNESWTEESLLAAAAAGPLAASSARAGEAAPNIALRTKTARSDFMDAPFADVARRFMSAAPSRTSARDPL